MKSKSCDFWGILFVAVLLAIFTAMPVSNAATISGTVFKEDGSNPVNDATIAVNVYEGAPCGSNQVVAQDTTGNGSFVIAGLFPGTYYLKAQKVSGTADYVDEWWASADSIWDCWGGEAITISNSEDVLANKDFQLDLYGSISGSTYDANGNLITENQILDVVAFRGSSCNNSEYIGVQDWLTDEYQLIKVPPGTYYVISSNKGSVWYVDEYHTVSGNTNNGVSNSCESATQVTVSSGTDTPDIDFQLDSGGRISGTVYKSDGATPITDADIRIFAFEGGSCNGRQFVDGTATSSGNYTIAGVPAGSYYLQAFRENGANYLSEWYSVPSSNGNCNDADLVQVWVGVETQNIHFQLDSGGSITGKLVDESGQPLGNVKVEYDNDVTSPHWYQAWSDPEDGTFTLSGIGPGGGQITVFSDPGRYLAGFRRTFYLEAGENKNIGTLEVQKGAIVSGMVTKDGVPQQAYSLSVGGKLIIAKVDTGADGTFSFVLPPGEFMINSDDAMDSFTTVPQTVVVAEADIMTNKNLPTIVVYDLSNGDVYNGTVMINTSPPTGAGIMITSFMNDQEFDLNNWGAMNPLSMDGGFNGLTVPNPYQLFTPPGSTVQLRLILYKSFSDGNESITAIDSASAVIGGGTYNFTYNNIGSTVDGYVTRQGEAVFWASVALYRQPGNEFVGFARTDHTGYYVIYNVPDGTYWVEATAEDYNGIYKMPSFDLNGNTQIDITLLGLGNCPTISNVDQTDTDNDGIADVCDNSPTVPIKPGDINNVGNINLTDAILALQVMSNITPSVPVFKEADIDGDGAIGLEEGFFALQVVAGLRENVNINSVLVGGWFLNPGALADSAVITFIDDTNYMFAVDGEPDDGGGRGMERGTYTWDSSSGAFTATAVSGTVGDWGISGLNNATISVNGNILNINDSVEGLISLTKVSSETNPIVGSWLHNPVSLATAAVLTFIDDENFMIAIEEEPSEPGTGGMQRGTYTWNPSTGNFTVTVISETVELYGISMANNSIVSVSETTLNVDAIGEDLVSFTRVH